jgi:DNA-binding phage protein
MYELEEMKKRLRGRNISELSREIGLHRNTLIDIRDGHCVDPRLSTLVKLTKALGLADGDDL